LLRLLVNLLAKLKARREAQPEHATTPFEPPILKVRRTGSLLLVIGGAGMIAITLASDDGSAMQDAPPPAAPIVQLGEEAASQEASQVRAPEAPSTQSLANPTGASLIVNVERSYPFTWPAEGPLTSEMGPWHPIGIDIGLEYEVDSPIWAAARGTVTFAGGEEWETYGHHVLIDHGGGMETLYAHLYEVFVEEGQAVRQGELLGYGGDTGVADGKHLHFEVHHDGSQIDPQHVLPPYDEDEPEPLSANCGEEAIVVDSGAPLLIDFGEALGGASISDVTIEKAKVSAQALPAVAEVESGGTVLFDTTPSVTGTGDDDEYRLIVAPGEDGLSELTCTIFVRTRTIAPSFYVRPTSTPTPLPPTETPIPPTPTDTPTPTPTPTPTKTPFPLPKAKS
jgi:hypothetical protein